MKKENLLVLIMVLLMSPIFYVWFYVSVYRLHPIPLYLHPLPWTILLCVLSYILFLKLRNNESGRN